jgi:hypothetical protein
MNALSALHAINAGLPWLLTGIAIGIAMSNRMVFRMFRRGGAMTGIWQMMTEQKPEESDKPGLTCGDCGCRIHRFERFVILQAKHRDCKDPKLVGQTSMAAREDA